MSTLFISDLHLDPDRPAITELFVTFLRGPAASARELYILGDLFEAWVGDDAPLAEYRRVIRGLAALRDRGVGVYVMHGNRDFLLGRRFAKATGATLLAEPTVIDLYGRPTAIMHGDTLCTDDVAYQEFRRKVRRRWLQRAFLSLPRQLRYRIVADMRRRSREHQTHKSAQIMDVNAQAVRDAFRTIGVTQIIHGHTHRPGMHVCMVDGRACRRIVLGDWYEQGSVLCCDRDGCRLHALDAGHAESKLRE
ncbi:MAG TPA: UDP-2,3-diacylglucosamine diphosphatase [Gammaproteobacteria bacterium]|nr:UDP-2,3-diacylglucosamine diphosphatase [Gammaproteobacteria bacterium]